MTDKIKRIIKKLQAVIDDTPFEGEKRNAENLLNKILKENNITLAELEKETSEVKWFYITSKKIFNGRHLSSQIVYRYYSEKHIDKAVYIGSNNREICFEATLEEYVEIMARIKFYSSIYKHELETFYSAFIQVNHLGSLPLSDEENDYQLTDRDVEIFAMMQGMKSHHMPIKNQIENKKVCEIK